MAKGPGPAKQKQVYQQKKRYTDEQSMMYEGCDCDNRNRPPGWLIDKIAEERILRGPKPRRSQKMCPKCFTLKTMNGQCMCL